MHERQRIILYGQSVVLGGVQASLRHYPQLDVMTVPPPATAQALAALAPDVILFDTGTGCSGPAFALLREQPGLLLIGVDPASQELLVLSSHPAQALGIADLVLIISSRNTDLEEKR